MILATTLNSIMKQHNVNENSGFVEERLIYRELNPSLKAAEAHTHTHLVVFDARTPDRRGKHAVTSPMH